MVQGVAVDTLEMALAMRRAGLPQEQAEVIAEQIGKGFASDELANCGHGAGTSR